MEIPINSNGDTGTLTEDDSLEQVGRAAASVQSLVCNTCRKPFLFFVFCETTNCQQNLICILKLDSCQQSTHETELFIFLFVVKNTLIIFFVFVFLCKQFMVYYKSKMTFLSFARRSDYFVLQFLSKRMKQRKSIDVSASGGSFKLELVGKIEPRYFSLLITSGLIMCC